MNSFGERLGQSVSRETLSRLESLVDLLKRWSQRINLVAPSTLADAWDRHILDSAQLQPLAPNARNWVDIGAGAGFPGLVVAALRIESAADFSMTLVESDARKAAFIREAARAMNINVKVCVTRVETFDETGFDVVSARALAPLTTLFGYAAPLLSPGGLCLFPKGRNASAEVDEARRSWHFTMDRYPSVTNEDSAILAVRDLTRV